MTDLGQFFTTDPLLQDTVKNFICKELINNAHILEPSMGIGHLINTVICCNLHDCIIDGYEIDTNLKEQCMIQPTKTIH